MPDWQESTRPAFDDTKNTNEKKAEIVAGGIVRVKHNDYNLVFILYHLKQ
jgi:hypothetical protein